jgi:uncharacterized Zn-binding protein involved in type VI secretion
MFASTKGGGVFQAFPNVCLVQAAPSPIPTPFPSIAQGADASAATCSTRVKFMNQPVILVGSEIPMSMGDEAGKALGGVVSKTAGDKVAVKNGSTLVKVEGKMAAMQFSLATHNGANANHPAGSQLAPSQAKVIIGR